MTTEIASPPCESIAILTATTSNSLLERNVRSVNALAPVEGVDIHHWIVVDGSQYEDASRGIVDSAGAPEHITRHVLVIPENTGGGGYLCHRIIAASSFLLNMTHLTVLDEDNEVEPNHIEALVGALRSVAGARWAYTLRSIIDHDSTFHCNDTCESLGAIKPTCLHPNDRLIDTNCYLWSMDIARQLAPLWMVKARAEGEMEADRVVCRTLLLHEPRGGCTRQFTVKYRAGVREGEGGSVSIEFFRRGMLTSKAWEPTKKDVYLFHFDKERTDSIMQRSLKFPLDEWCTTITEELGEEVNLINGYDCLDFLPHDATCLVNLCHPATSCLMRLKALKDATHPNIKRVVYMAEGPNMRHQTQWSKEFLNGHADVVLTYTKVMHSPEYLKGTTFTTAKCKHNARFVNKGHARDPRIFRKNMGKGSGTVAMVLENRQGKGEYEIDGVKYTCIDKLRSDLATGFGPSLTVVGKGWTKFCEDEKVAGRPVPTLGYDMPRHTDRKTSLDTYEMHDFALVAENCGGPGAKGYISEKLGDALLSGCVPVYWGENIPDDETFLLQGEGVWWIDARRCIPWAAEKGVAEKPLGEKLRLFLEIEYGPDKLKEMKEHVLEHREEYLFQRGSKAYADAVMAAV